MGFGSFVHHATHSISHPSSSIHSGISKIWGGGGNFTHHHLIGGNPATWSPIPYHNPVVSLPTKGVLSPPLDNPFSDLKKRIEGIIPSADPRKMPTKTPSVGQSSSLLSNPLLLLGGLGVAGYFIMKK
ncbi:MAG: hypothetical protein U9P79_06795 [Candidatus Cloacimonadota bacterium]|nr:hypothetical protein [Candidatus Cloacimonadota bacterium]